MPKRILLVEDEQSLSDVIQLNLELANYYVQTCENGLVALNTAQNEQFDLIILDIMLPGLDGFNVCESLRLKNINTPILILSAKGSSSDKVKGLKMGANDYLSKPFDLEELMLRVKNLLNIKQDISLDILRFGSNKVDVKSFIAANGNGTTKKLSETEMKFLTLLHNNINNAVSRKEIFEKVWGFKSLPNTRTIDNFILNFRKFFEENPNKPMHFISIRGIGYKLTSDNKNG